MCVTDLTRRNQVKCVGLISPQTTVTSVTAIALYSSLIEVTDTSHLINQIVKLTVLKLHRNLWLPNN
jgi:hypothetical protein